MKFYETHFEEYIQENKRMNLHFMDLVEQVNIHKC